MVNTGIQVITNMMFRTKKLHKVLIKSITGFNLPLLIQNLLDNKVGSYNIYYSCYVHMTATDKKRTVLCNKLDIK